MPGAPLLDGLSALDDPRQAGEVVYPLSRILSIALCATMEGAEDLAEIERRAKRTLGVLRQLSPLARGAPSHETPHDRMNAPAARLFSDCFVDRVDALRTKAPEIIAIDGKTLRRARGRSGAPLRLVSSRPSRWRLVLGEEAFENKGDHIIAILRLLEGLGLTGALATIDAIGCQREIAAAIRTRDTDHLLASKGDWPLRSREVELYFDQAPEGGVEAHQTTDADHGRIETRGRPASLDVGWRAADMASFRYAAMNLIRATPDNASKKIRRKSVGGDEDPRFKTVTRSHSTPSNDPLKPYEMHIACDTHFF